MNIDTLISRLSAIRAEASQSVKINVRVTKTDGKEIWIMSDIQDVYEVSEDLIVLDALN